MLLCLVSPNSQHLHSILFLRICYLLYVLLSCTCIWTRLVHLAGLSFLSNFFLFLLLEIKKSPNLQMVPKTKQIMTYFHLMRPKKHKNLSIFVLNMAKYTIISLILTDFVPIFFIFNLFWKNCRGSFRFKKVPIP